MPQCCRTAWENRPPCAGSEVRNYRVAICPFSPTARHDSTLPILCHLAQEVLAPSESISEVIPYRRVAIRRLVKKLRCTIFTEFTGQLSPAPWLAIQRAIAHTHHE
jgi:hypothetical protein